MKTASDCPEGEIAINVNPCCFIAIEAESKTSRKHRMGNSIINAGGMGKVGIVIAKDDKVFESLKKIRKHLNYPNDVKRVIIDNRNVIIATENVFIEIVKKYNVDGNNR